MASGIYVLERERLKFSVCQVENQRGCGPTLEEAWLDHN